jgi:hypothetical protein
MGKDFVELRIVVDKPTHNAFKGKVKSEGRFINETIISLIDDYTTDRLKNVIVSDAKVLDQLITKIRLLEAELMKMKVSM